MGGYKQEEIVMEEKRGWKELYFLLGKGEKTCFLRECNREEKEVATQFETVLEEIENFRKPETELSSIVITSHMEIFEKIIKLAVLGKYEPLFDKCDITLNAVEDPWLILMTKGFSSSGSGR